MQAEQALSLRAADVATTAAAEAAVLQAAGIGTGDSVGWLALNSPRALALLAACEQLGARYVPLNWRLAAAELAAQVRHAGLQRLLHDDAQAPLAAEVAALAPLPQPRAAGHRDGDVMLVYTSGTTGEPKGAIHTGAGMRANIAMAIATQGLGEHTRTLAVLPLFHVGGLCIQVLPTLAAGGRVRLHARFDADAWFDDVAAWRPTTTLLVPAVMRALIEHPRWAGADLSSLTFVSAGSSVVPRPLIDAFHARGIPVAQVYGATETGPVTLVLPPAEALAHAGSVGRPAPGVDVRLVAGELQVRAPNLARGYHGRPDDRAFMPDGWFATGDLARVDGDGRYQIVGRLKELIISGGENILPAEIEQIALEDPAVAEAVAIGLPDARWGEVPVLAIVARPAAAPDLAQLRAAFDTRLARFKHPRRIVVLDELPKTALGKVAREALKARLLA
jgi:fatty-acyl-CoA synthase